MLNARFAAVRLLSGAALLAIGGPGLAADYYVDFDAGHDSAAGTSAAAPWQHAPGDANAAGAPAGGGRRA